MATQYITLADGKQIPVEGTRDYDSGMEYDLEGALNDAGYVSVPSQETIDWYRQSGQGDFASPEQYLQWLYGGGSLENTSQGQYFKTPNGVSSTVNTPLTYNKPAEGWDAFMEGGGALAIPLTAAGIFDPSGLAGALGFGGAGDASIFADAAIGPEGFGAGYEAGLTGFGGGGGMDFWDDILNVADFGGDDVLDIQSMIDNGALTLDDVDNFGLWDSIQSGAGGLWDSGSSLLKTLTGGSKLLGGIGGLSPLDLALLAYGLKEGQDVEPTVTTQSASVGLPDWYTNAAQDLVSKASDIEPSNAWQGYLDKATGYTDAAAGGLPSIDLGTYMNPYLDSVLDPMRERALTEKAQTLQGIDNRAASVNAFGRNRADLLKTQAGESADRTWNETEARIRSGAFDTAASNATRDLDRRSTAGKTYADYAKTYGDLDMTSRLLPITAYSTALKGLQLPTTKTATSTTTNPPPSLIGQTIGGLGALSRL